MAFITGPVPESLDREVTATVAEFARDLAKAWPAGVEALGEGQFRLAEAAVTLTIVASPAGTRRLGLFALPVLAVRYRFEGGDEPARRQLLARLDRAMQRGGG